MTLPGVAGPPDRRAELGRGLAVVDGDLVLDDGVLRQVDGTANLLQGLTLRVLTPYGTDRFRADYGLDVTQALTGPHGRGTARALLRLNLVRTLAGDPRVREVRDVVFTEAPGSARTASVEVVLETVAGTVPTLLVDPGLAEPS